MAEMCALAELAELQGLLQECGASSKACAPLHACMHVVVVIAGGSFITHWLSSRRLSTCRAVRNLVCGLSGTGFQGGVCAAGAFCWCSWLGVIAACS